MKQTTFVISYALAFFLPTTVYFFIQNILLEQGCDSKFGCESSFVIMALIFGFFSALSVLSVFVPLHLFCERASKVLSRFKALLLLLMGGVLGASFQYVLMNVPENYGLIPLVAVYMAVPALITFLLCQTLELKEQ
uniref:hypothetical protein n=1 Tax=Thaumasiovibrio occultus TaxID=1891184 RepID=UPI000B34C84F|nr:hypothetical protein [Thaumasiovibrio occultus]